MFLQAKSQLERGFPSDAERILAHLLSLNPNDANALHLMGALAAITKRPTQAADYFRRALEIAPDEHSWRSNYAKSLAALQDFAGAHREAARALAGNPKSGPAMSVLGRCHLVQGDKAQGEEWLRRAVEGEGEITDALWMLALLCRERMDLNAASDFGKRARAQSGSVRAPQLAIWDVDLLLGDFPAAWKHLEYRWNAPEIFGAPRHQNIPRWRGESAPNKTLLLWCEQGLGDTVQFIRFAAEAARRIPRIVLECPPVLKDMFVRLPWFAAVRAAGEPLLSADVQCSIWDLPDIFQTPLEKIGEHVPYLSCDEKSKARWLQRLGSSPALKVGLAWAGNPKNLAGATRTMQLSDLAPLGSVPNVEFHSLQIGPAAAQVGSIAGLKVADHATRLNSVDQTAGLICSLDLVITIDSFVAHLAGALGRPVWMTIRQMPDWRWLVGRTDSPWYPTMRIFRQAQESQWQSVIEEVRARLADLASKS
jgi:Tfp pilus assembly protein PilF